MNRLLNILPFYWKVDNIFVRREPQVYFAFRFSVLKACVGSVLCYSKDCRMRTREQNHLKFEKIWTESLGSDLWMWSSKLARVPQIPSCICAKPIMVVSLIDLKGCFLFKRLCGLLYWPKSKKFWLYSCYYWCLYFLKPALSTCII